jgi:ProP effector
MSDDLVEKLAALWPKAFFINQDARKPLKLGIHRDMVGHAHGLSGTDLRRALGQYCNSPGYLAACTEGAERIDLNGMFAGTVTAEAVAAAVRMALSQKTLQREAKVEKAVAVAAVPERQVALKNDDPKNGNAIKLSLSDLRAAAARRRQATGV